MKKIVLHSVVKDLTCGHSLSFGGFTSVSPFVTTVTIELEECSDGWEMTWTKVCECDAKSQKWPSLWQKLFRIEPKTIVEPWHFLSRESKLLNVEEQSRLLSKWKAWKAEMLAKSDKLLIFKIEDPILVAS